MGKLVVTEFVTADGVMEDPGGAEGGRGGWAFQFDRGEAGNRFKFEELMAADAQLLGRVTYEGFARAWPQMRGDEFGEKMNAMPKHVVSGAPLEPEWENASRLEGDLGPAVSALKERYSGDVLVAGSATLVQALTALGLVDEYRLMIHPVVLGAGKRLFGDTEQPVKLALRETREAGECVILFLEPHASA
jgi:dihydrofolate reductase